MEAINFGVSATGPRQYYYRIKDVGVALKPNAIVLDAEIPYVKFQEQSPR